MRHLFQHLFIMLWPINWRCFVPLLFAALVCKTYEKTLRPALFVNCLTHSFGALGSVGRNSIKVHCQEQSTSVAFFLFSLSAHFVFKMGPTLELLIAFCLWTGWPHFFMNDLCLWQAFINKVAPFLKNPWIRHLINLHVNVKKWSPILMLSLKMYTVILLRVFVIHIAIQFLIQIN